MRLQLDKLPAQYREQALAQGAGKPKIELDLPAIKGRAKGVHKPGAMNGIERKWADELERRRRENLILAWWFEPVKFRLAKATYYTPDFMALNHLIEIEFYEVKAFWKIENGPHSEDDARVKIKVAALYPFRFFVVYQKNGIWLEEQV